MNTRALSGLKQTPKRIKLPTGRFFPNFIVPEDFQLENIWTRLPANSRFFQMTTMPSPASLGEVKRPVLPTVSSEALAISFYRSTVEDQVKILFLAALQDAEARRVWRLDWKLLCQNHTRLGGTGNAALKTYFQAFKDACGGTHGVGHVRDLGPTDEFFISRGLGSDNSKRIIVACEAKAPHKLTAQCIKNVLGRTLDVHKHVLDAAEPQDYRSTEWEEWNDRRRVGAVVTQLFQQMVFKGVRRGCIITGEAFIFLRIGADPARVSADVYVPGLDKPMERRPERLFQTGVARLFAFFIEAAHVGVPDAAWVQRASRLQRWEEFRDKSSEHEPMPSKSDAQDEDFIGNSQPPTATDRLTRQGSRRRDRRLDAEGSTRQATHW